VAGEFDFGAALLARVRANLAGFDRRELGSEHGRPAAVALTLFEGEAGRACFVLTRRASGLRRHGGQWASPGGRVDPGETPEQTALRELDEEVGLRPRPPVVLGRLDDYATRSGFVITPVVVWAADAGALRANPREVEAAYAVPLEEIDHTEPYLHAIPESERPVLSLPFRGDFVHAPTAAILWQLMEVAVRGRSTRVAHYEQPLFAWK
jgi:8-oxo-dGTP pyrophosphatase MutT (NUDIX family)